MKLQVQDTCKKDEKSTTIFEAVNDEDVINKGYPDEKLSKRKGHVSILEKDYNEFKLQYNKQPVEEILIQMAVKRLCKYFMIKVYLMLFYTQINY